ncbi:hypothetical protein D3C81_1798500 [compost metagenome]
MELFDCTARLRISSAITTNPFPAAPALDASIEAFRERMLVCLVISTIGAKILRMEYVLLLSLPEFSSINPVIRETDSVFSTKLAIYSFPC